jgi:hypothetical protein
MKPIPSPDLHGPADRYMVLEPTAGSNPYFRANNAIRSNLDIRSDLRAGIDQCGRMNLH